MMTPRDHHSLLLYGTGRLIDILTLIRECQSVVYIAYLEGRITEQEYWANSHALDHFYHQTLDMHPDDNELKSTKMMIARIREEVLAHNPPKK